MLLYVIKLVMWVYYLLKKKNNNNFVFLEMYIMVILRGFLIIRIWCCLL